MVQGRIGAQHRARQGRRRQRLTPAWISREAIRTTGAVREFADEPVADSLVAALLDDARFAPSGGNRQPWRVALVKDVAPAAPAGGADAAGVGRIRRRLAIGFGAVQCRRLPPAARARARRQRAARRHRHDPGGAGVAADLRRDRRRWTRSSTERRSSRARRSTRSAGTCCSPPATRPRRRDDHVPLARRARGGATARAAGHTTRWRRRSSSGYPVHQPTSSAGAPVEEFASVDTFRGSVPLV